MKKLTFIIITSLFIMTNLSYADYHYASHTGTNTYPYTSWETAADTIQNAVNAASPGDSIYIGSGEYQEVIWMTVDDSLMALIGRGIDSTWIHVIAVAQVMQPGPKAYIKNIHFSNTGTNTNLAPRLHWDMTVENCLFSGGRGMLIVSSNVVVRNCIFDNLGFLNSGIEEVFQNQSIEVSNCLFANLSGGSAFTGSTLNGIIRKNIYLRNFTGETAFDIHYVENGHLVIENNIVSDLVSAALVASFSDTTSSINNNVIDNQHYHLPMYAVWLYLPSYNAKMVNNSITDCGNGIRLAGNNQLSVHYSNFWDIDSVSFGIGETYHGSFDTTFGLIHANPMYDNPDSGDFRLQMYSPLIDAGDPAIFDYDGSRSDIGAFGGPGGYFYQYIDLLYCSPLIKCFDM